MSATRMLHWVNRATVHMMPVEVHRRIFEHMRVSCQIVLGPPVILSLSLHAGGGHVTRTDTAYGVLGTVLINF